MSNQNTKCIGIIGARILPDSYKDKIKGIVKDLLDKGYNIVSGGATGADNFALEALLSFGQAQRGVIFSAWQHLAQFPAMVKVRIEKFIVEGGKIDWGYVPFNACRNAVVAGLLGRNIKLVSAANGLVAFLHGESRGTSFTIRQAAKRKVPVIAFLCGANASLPSLPQGNWRILQNETIWAGAFKIVY